MIDLTKIPLEKLINNLCKASARFGEENSGLAVFAQSGARGQMRDMATEIRRRIDTLTVALENEHKLQMHVSLRLEDAQRDIGRLQSKAPHGFSRKMLDIANLAAVRGAYEGLTTDAHLGEAVRKYGYAARTLAGDTFEYSFEWARDQKDD